MTSFPIAMAAWAAWARLVRNWRLVRALRALQKAQHQFEKLDEPILQSMTAHTALCAYEKVIDEHRHRH